MAHIEVNFEGVPDKFLPIPAGDYNLRINTVEVGPTKDGSGKKVVVELEVDDETSEFNGRKLYEHIGLKNPIALKQLVKSCGLEAGPGGVDTDELIGKVCKARVKTRTYTDPADGTTKETAAVAQFLFE